MSEAIKEMIPEEEIEIRSDIEAGWQLDRRKKIIEDRDELVAFYKERIKAVEDDAKFKLGFIDRSLEAFFKTVKHHKTATQESYTLPGGKLVLKRQNPEFKRDDATVIEWLKKNNAPQYIKVKEELDWATLKDDTTVVGTAIVNSDGETIPGVEVVEREPKFAVENVKAGVKNG